MDSTSLDQGLKSIKSKLGEISTAWAGVGVAIVGSMGMMAKAAADEQANINLLRLSLKNVGISYDAVKDSLEGVITATQRKTGIADSQQRDVLNRLLLVTNDYNKALKLLPLTLDLAAAGQMDASTAATYLGKGLLELEGGAEKVTIRLGQASIQVSSLEELMDRVGGAAEAAVNPFAVLKNEISDMGENIGMILLPVVKDLVSQFTGIVDVVKAYVDQNPQLVKALAAGALGIAGVISAVFALKAALLLLGTTANLMFGGILIAIGALVTGAALIWMTWDAQLHAARDAFSNFKNAVYHTVDAILVALQTLVGWIPSFGDKLDKARAKLANLIEVEKIKRDIWDTMRDMKSLETAIAETTETAKKLSTALDPDLVEAQKAAAEAAGKLIEEEKALGERFADLMRQLQFAESEAGKLGITMDDVYTAMYKLGYKTQEINSVFRRYGDVTEIDEALLGELGLTANDVARLVGKLKGQTDSGTASLKAYGDAAKATNDEVSKMLATLAGAKEGVTTGGATGVPISAADFEAINNARSAAVAAVMAKEGISREAALALVEPATYGSVARYVEALKAEAPQYVSPELHTAYGVGEQGLVQTVTGYQHGGMIREPTLLYGLKSMRPYAIAGEAGPEPVGFPSVNITGNNFYVREEADIDRVGQALVNKIRARTGVKI
uniref:Putative tail protein n=1 Tax=viral metagenome TaxID=1070528 RepID=A0A6M3KJK1_9ZZZZ